MPESGTDGRVVLFHAVAALGLQELLWDVGIVVLLGVLIFTAMRGGRRRDQQRAADEATRRNFDKL